MRKIGIHFIIYRDNGFPVPRFRVLALETFSTGNKPRIFCSPSNFKQAAIFENFFIFVFLRVKLHTIYTPKHTRTQTPMEEISLNVQQVVDATMLKRYVTSRREKEMRTAG